MIEISPNATLDELKQALVLVSNGVGEVNNIQLNAIKALISLRLSERRINNGMRNQAILNDEDKNAFNII